jgi:hypothetical protein
LPLFARVKRDYSYRVWHYCRRFDGDGRRRDDYTCARNPSSVRRRGRDLSLIADEKRAAWFLECDLDQLNAAKPAHFRIVSAQSLLSRLLTLYRQLSCTP